MSEKNTPEIRMRGFDGFWSILPFAELVDRKSQQISPNGSLTVEFEDINAGEGTLNKDLAKKSNHKAGIPFTPEDILFGKLRPYLKNWLLADFSGIAVGDFWVLQATNSNPAFIHATIQRPEFMAVANMTSGTKMPRSDWGLVSTTTFSVPSIAEQKSIGSFFRELDTVLEAGEQKLEKLRQLKQTMLLKMFPQGDSLVPEVRFAGFTEHWKPSPFNDTFCFSKPLILSRSQLNYTEGKGLSIHYGDILTKLHSLVSTQNGELPYISDNTLVAKSMNNQLEDGDIVMADTAEDESVGRCVELKVDSDIPTFAGLHTHALHPLGKFASGFLGIYMNTNGVHDQIVQLSQGTKVTSVSKEALKGTSFLIPSYEEQEMISSYFRELDTLLEAEAEKLAKLRQLKSAFLRQMFV